MTDGQRVVVAVDAMGGDRAPGEIVAGAARAVAELDVGVLLVGRAAEIEPLLRQSDGPDVPEGLEVLDAADVIAMDDEPLSAVRKQKDSSIVRAVEAVKDGRADAVVSAGNTGAVTTAAVLRLGRFKGVPSPAIAVPIPVAGQHPQVLVDAGAVVNPAPERLAQYAVMASEYAQVRWDLATPRIGLLSNGEEAGKGDELRKAAYPLLERSPWLRRQRRGPRLHARRHRRRHRHRRLHRQHRAEDARGCAARAVGPGVRGARCRPTRHGRRPR